MKLMLAAKADMDQLRFPLLASPKIDGIRATVIDGVVYSRNMKPIPNRHVQKLFGRQALNGFDGELVVGEPHGDDVFRRTTSGVMSVEGEPDVSFHLFDYTGTPYEPFSERLRTADLHAGLQPGTTCVTHEKVGDVEELADIVRMHLERGFEGTMVRCPNGPYKHGRSTVREGYLLKVKMFEDSEARIIGTECQYHNANEATRNAAGKLERSTAKEGKVPLAKLGTLYVRDIYTQVEFNVGTGFTDEERTQLWAEKDSLLGQVIRYRYFPTGAKDKPRFPTFTGFRKDI